MRTLKDVKIGETVRVTKVGGEGAIKKDHGYGHNQRRYY